MTDIPTKALRRAALKAQGLLDAAPFGRGLSGALRALQHLGFVQIDTISVVARAHHHTLWARVPGYSQDHLDRLVARRDAFEYWFHAASYLPMRDYPFALPRMRAIKRGERHWFRTRDEALMQAVLDRIRAEGALRARDFEHAAGPRKGWWDWKPAKRALEQLFMQGDLMVAGRNGFEKIYDLPERVLPGDVDTREPTPEEHARHLVDVTLGAHGFATLKSFTYGRKGSRLREAVKRSLATRVAEGSLEQHQATGADGRRLIVFAVPGLLDEAMRVKAEVRILSPFDNALIQRDRNLAIHGFDYQLECYVQKENRKFGYFCLPLLYRDRFVGRADCKAHRARGELEVRALFVESAIEDEDRFVDALSGALERFAEFNGCTTVVVASTRPRRWAGPIRRALASTRA